MDAPIESYQYLRDSKYCSIAAVITREYPTTLARDPSIAASLMVIENAERAINARVVEIVGRDE